MTSVLIDANVLLDVMTEDARWFAWAAEAIERAADRYRLVIKPVIYAQVSIRYSRIEELDAALPKTMFDREAIPYAAAFLAGESFLAYRRRVEQSNRRFPTFSSAPMRLSPGIC
jgi:predicted nucleic acid-binding protein